MKFFRIWRDRCLTCFLMAPCLNVVIPYSLIAGNYKWYQLPMLPSPKVWSWWWHWLPALDKWAHIALRLTLIFHRFERRTDATYIWGIKSYGGYWGQYETQKVCSGGKAARKVVSVSAAKLGLSCKAALGAGESLTTDEMGSWGVQGICSLQSMLTTVLCTHGTSLTHRRVIFGHCWSCTLVSKDCQFVWCLWGCFLCLYYYIVIPAS